MVRRKPLDLSTLASANHKPLEVDIPRLGHLPKELAHYRPSDPFDRGYCRYVPPHPPSKRGISIEKTNKNKALIIVTIWEFSNLTSGQSAFAERVKNIAPALFSVPLVTNLVITGLIVWRIKQAQETTKFTSNRKLYAFYRRLLRNTIESCALYPFFLMVTLILYCLHDNGQDIVSPFQDDPHALEPVINSVAFLFRSSPAQWPKSCPSFQR